jgi:hypothetical protein
MVRLWDMTVELEFHFEKNEILKLILCTCCIMQSLILRWQRLLLHTLISPSVLPALKLKGSKNPKGAVCPARPSADIDTLANEGRAMTAGRKATAEAAREAMRTAWNIVEE